MAAASSHPFQDLSTVLSSQPRNGHRRVAEELAVTWVAEELAVTWSLADALFCRLLCLPTPALLPGAGVLANSPAVCRK